MYFRLAVRSLKRSAKDYLIYFVTLVLCVAMFYSFLSISSQYYSPSLDIEYNINMLSDGMKVAVLFITSIILFLIQYVNAYMIRRRQKEFAIQTVMGMEQKTTAILFFSETLMIGVIAIAMGIVLGSFISQVITAIIMESFNQEYKIYFSLFLDTTVISTAFFLLIFCLVGVFNMRTICRIKIIDMLNADKKTEEDFKEDRIMPFLIWLGGLCSIFAFVRGYALYNLCYDPRLLFSTRLTFYANMLLPALFFTRCILYLVTGTVKKNKKRLPRLVGELSIVAVFMALFETRVTAKDFTINADIESLYLLLSAFYLLFSVFGLFYCISNLIVSIKRKFPNIKYKDTNLFLFGQLIGKIKTSSKTMAMISITLCGSMIAMTLAPVLSAWSLGYLDERAIFDTQIFTQYHNVIEEENLPKTDYQFAEDYLIENGVDIEDSLEVPLYFLNKTDFKKRIKYDFPVLAMSLSDYNHLLKMADIEPIELDENEFTMQWRITATEKERAPFASQNKRISTEESVLYLAENTFYQASLGESIYNDYTDVIYIIPDPICETLMVANRNHYMNTKDKIPFDVAKGLEDYLYKQMKQNDLQTGNTTNIRIKTLQFNGGITGALMVRLILFYLGVVLTIICFTILSLQQLADSSDFKYRFSVLRKLGVSEKAVKSIALKQMGVWFGLPIIIAIASATIILGYIIKNSLQEILAYVGTETLMVNIIAVSGVIFTVLICYFVSTWILFQRNIGSD